VTNDTKARKAKSDERGDRGSGIGGIDFLGKK
jgi:hypothetical protein